jgi:hypothetical protein
VIDTGHSAFKKERTSYLEIVIRRSKIYLVGPTKDVDPSLGLDSELLHIWCGRPFSALHIECIDNRSSCTGQVHSSDVLACG